MTDERIKTLIVDDEPLARDLLTRLIEKDASLDLVGTSVDGGAALADISRLKPELVFLDVQMPVLDGIGVVNRLLHRRNMPHIVFVTAFDQYAIKAFELNVLDYLLKPIEKERFYPTVDRAKKAITHKKIIGLAERMLGLVTSFDDAKPSPVDDGSFLINTGQKLVSVAPEDIIWVEAANQYVTLHTAGESFLMSENLSQFSARLDTHQFVRVHRSATINIKRLVSVARRGSGAHTLRLEGGAEVVLARGRADLLPMLLKMAAINTGNPGG